MQHLDTAKKRRGVLKYIQCGSDKLLMTKTICMKMYFIWVYYCIIQAKLKCLQYIFFQMVSLILGSSDYANVLYSMFNCSD